MEYIFLTRELLWSLKKCHRTFSLLEDVFIDSRSEIKDKWLKLESPAKLFFNHAFLSILQVRVYLKILIPSLFIKYI